MATGFVTGAHWSYPRGSTSRRQSVGVAGAGRGSAGAGRGNTGADRQSGRKRQYFATCARGLGDILRAEIAAHVTRDITYDAASGVGFEGDEECGYRAAMFLRTATRVLEVLGTADVERSTDVYRAVRAAVPWHAYVGAGQTFSVQVRSSSGGEMGIRVRTKDAICDALVDKTGARPLPPASHSKAHVPLFVAQHAGQLTMYRDLGGDSLHKRGYRAETIHASSLNECAAAAMAMMAGLGDERDHGIVVDPMCGSATLLIESALLKLRVAPGLMRKEFPLESWSDFDAAAWRLVRERALEMELDPETALEGTKFLGNDIHGGAASLAEENIRRAGLADFIAVHHGDVEDLEPHGVARTVLCNPPWGRRLEDEEEAWRKLGFFLKQHVCGGEAYVLCGSPEVSRHLRMRADSKHPVRLGNVDCRILKYRVLERRDKS